MIRTFALRLSSDQSPYVERPSPGAAPSAFRIWAAGENRSDEGTTSFSPRSAELLLAEQEARGRLYPSDFDHLSLISNRPAESGRASGYHRLEVRQSATGPELWAADIEWCPDVKAGLEEQPPRWKYFSPAFKQDENGEVYSYVNFALCINPKTHHLPSLASIGTGEKTMNKKAMRAFLAKMAEGANDEAAKTAYATIAAAIGDDDGDEKAPEAKSEGSDEKKPPEANAPPEASEDKAEKKSEPPVSESEKCAVSANSIGGELASELAKANAKIGALEIQGMLDKRSDLAEPIKRWCMLQDSVTVRSYLSAHPKGHAPRQDATTQPPAAVTSGIGLSGRELEEMDEQMGVNAQTPKGPSIDGQGRFVLHTVRPSDMSKVQLLNHRKAG